MKHNFSNWATAGVVAATLVLPSTASAQHRSGSPGARESAPAPAAPAPPPAAAPAPAPASAPASGSTGSEGASGGSGQTRQRSGGGGGGQARGGAPTRSGGGEARGGAPTRSGGGDERSGSGGGGGGRRADGGNTGATGSAAPPSRSSGDGTYTRHASEGRPTKGRAGGTTVIVPGGGYYPWAWGGLGFGGYYGGYYGGLYDPWGYDGYDGGYQGGGGYSSGYGDDGRLRLQVKPREASVYIDGYFAGIVDEFDGTFQRLKLDSGPHRVEIRADGYETLTFEVRIDPGHTVNYKGELKKLP